MQYFLDERYSPDKLLGQIERHLGKPYLRTPQRGGGRPTLEHAFVAAFRQARTLWLQIAPPSPNCYSIIQPQPAEIWRNTSPAGWERWTPATWRRKPQAHPVRQVRAIHRHQTASLDQQGQGHPNIRFRRLRNAANRLRALVDYCRHQIPVKCWLTVIPNWPSERQRQLQSYDDLLLDLHAALRHPDRARRWWNPLRHRYAAALIDEFQDTDPVQYAIFRDICTDAGKPVFLVSDPKRAIYSFRGADIFAYLAARNDTPDANRHTLDVNWRSDPRLLTALNAVFGAVGDQPFLFDGIPSIPRSRPMASGGNRFRFRDGRSRRYTFGCWNRMATNRWTKATPAARRRGPPPPKSPAC